MDEYTNEFTRNQLIEELKDYIDCIVDDKKLAKFAEQFGIYVKPVGYGLFQEHSYDDGLDGQEEIIEELTND